MYRKFWFHQKTMSVSVSGKNVSRSGYTIIELIVSVTVIGVLFAISLPAVQSARNAARRIHCLNNMRNVSLAITQATDRADRFPACGYYGDGTPATVGSYRSWVVDILPFIDQGTIYDQWNFDKAFTDPVNRPLSHSHIPVLSCPDDFTQVEKKGNLTYVVSSGVGFSALMSGVHDCPIDPTGTRLDLNGNSIACNHSTAGDGITPSDRELFAKMGVFFNETWKGIPRAKRHHTMASITDGVTNTMMISENIRTGYNPEKVNDNWASPSPFLTSFYIGNPCLKGNCAAGNVDYSRSNSGVSAINGGLSKPERTSPYPNSAHSGGVHIGFCDGRVQFVSEGIDGKVYASLASPQGESLGGTPLEQHPISGGEY